MDLFILILIFALIGYLLGVSDFGKQVDRTAEKAVLQTKKLAERVDGRWKGWFSGWRKRDAFRSYVAGAGAELFPQAFKTWLKGLSEAEAADFSRALEQYSSSLGFSLKSLVEGGLDHDPRMRQVFVEAITIYSSAYRKARDAHQQSEKARLAQPQPESAAPPADSGSESRTAESPPEASAVAQAN